MPDPSLTVSGTGTPVPPRVRRGALAPVLAQGAAVSVVVVVALSWVGGRAPWLMYVFFALAFLVLSQTVLRLVRAPFPWWSLAMLGVGFLVCAVAATVMTFLVS